jgi:hypothetical protein
MKKVKYIVLMFILCILLTGCDIDYKIEIGEDLTVNETIRYIYGIDLYDEEYGGVDQDVIDQELEEKLNIARENNYQIIDNSTDDTIALTFNRTINFASFKDPVVLNRVYENFKTNCNSSFCSITARAIKNEIAGDGEVTNYKTSITVPYRVIKSNADEIDEMSNTHTWYYVIEGKQNDIELIFERTGKNIIKENEQKEDTNSLIWFIIISIVVVTISVIVYKIIKNSKPNL